MTTLPIQNSESINHYYSASILAQGYSSNILIPNRLSKVKTINMYSLLKYIKNNNIADKKLTDQEINYFTNDIISNKNIKNSVLMDKICENIFQTPALKENNIQSQICSIESNFLNFVRSGKTLNSDLDICTVFNYLKLTYARCPKVNQNYSTDFWKTFQNFKEYFPYTPYLFEININENYFMLSDLAPTILITGNNLIKNNLFHLTENEINILNTTPFLFFPFTPKKAFILYFKSSENIDTRKIIESIILNSSNNFSFQLLINSLTYTFLRLVYHSDIETFIINSLLEILTLNYSNTIQYRKENKYLNFKNHLHQNN